jgi:hypothetical protein
VCCRADLGLHQLTGSLLFGFVQGTLGLSNVRISRRLGGLRECQGTQSSGSLPCQRYFARLDSYNQNHSSCWMAFLYTFSSHSVLSTTSSAFAIKLWGGSTILLLIAQVHYHFSLL